MGLVGVGFDGEGRGRGGGEGERGDVPNAQIRDRMGGVDRCLDVCFNSEAKSKNETQQKVKSGDQCKVRSFVEVE